VIEKFVNELITKGYFPGVELFYARQEKVLYHQAFGQRMIVPNREPLQLNTIFDLASLTKPMVTALLVVLGVQRGLIKLSTQIKSLFPQLKSEVTIFDLLTHQAGLPDYFPFFLDSRSMLEIFLEILPARAAKVVNYSCPGYILLKAVIDKIFTLSAEKVAEKEIFNRLKLNSTGFSFGSDLMSRIAPTELGNQYEKRLCLKRGYEAAKKFPFRQNLIHGTVHDCNSYYLGGFGGNAGLFSTAKELWKLSQEFFPETAQILKSEFVMLFWKKATNFPVARTIGFKLNRGYNASGGKALSRNAIGHNGFTGTSIWLDYSDREVVIVLSNAVHPVVGRLKLNPLRRKLHFLLKKAIN